MQKYANLVELEKCCQTHIFLQNFVLIQPRTSPPKICKICKICHKSSRIASLATRQAPRARCSSGRSPRRCPSAASRCSPTASPSRRSRRARRSRAAAPGQLPFFWAKLWQNFARFRLYRHRSLQVSTRLSAFFKIYQLI